MKGFIFNKGEPLSEEIRELLTKNGCETLEDISDQVEIAGKLHETRNFIVFPLLNTEQSSLAELEDLKTLCDLTKLNVLVPTEQANGSTLGPLGFGDRLQPVFYPLNKTKVQIGIRMLLADKDKAPRHELRFMPAFNGAVKRVFKDLIQKEVNEVNQETRRGELELLDVTGIMLVTGELKGQIMVSLPQSAAYDFANIMTGGAVKQIGDEIYQSAISECINQVAGHSRVALKKLAYDFDFDTPKVIRKGINDEEKGTFPAHIVTTFENEKKQNFNFQLCLVK